MMTNTLTRSAVAGLLLLLSLAAALRGVGLWKGPGDFEPVRQYHSALIARYLEYLVRPSAEPWRREMARTTVQPIHEPPLMESVAAFGYLVRGDEDLLFPRLAAGLAWLVAGLLAFALIRDLLGTGAALAGSAWYLLNPYGIRQSLSFQPESLALALTWLALWGILRWYRDPRERRLRVAGGLAALAILVKPQVVFLIFGGFIGLGLRRRSLFSLATAGTSWRFATIALVVPAFYVVLDLWIGGITAQRGLIPATLLDPRFYLSWLYNVEKVVGFPVLLLSGLGTLMLRGDARALALGLWGGYVLFGMVFTFHFATHPYYHVSIFPAVTLGLAGLAAPLLEYGQAELTSVWRWGTGLSVASLAALLTLGPVVRSFHVSDAERRGVLYARAGAAAGHSPDSVLLARYEGCPLRFYGWVGGTLWPTLWQRTVDRHGLKAIAVGEVLETGPTEAEVAARFEEFGGRYDHFVVTSMEEWRRQPALGRYLHAHYRQIAGGDDYLVFDLRSLADPSQKDEL